MTQTIKFGRQATQRPPFEINGLSFSSLPLSLAEERDLASAGQDAESDDAVMDALLEKLADLLNTRAQGQPVTVAWLMEHLTPGDLEGIVAHLRGEDTE
ncbi:hypothetical protein [Deinococcus multiflagellatus]|uniref:Tail assembly chaperone n=1 Tax=Deinococcus multiflagellatus TaxID=1656887 RepID=A0ABW1ZKT8_9DEIO|nr:hypothetical protein [Deinococcus multiflagellatus]MBZ9714861.1 hypothetical protein [Deinococcus multiflagellatus]